MEDNENEPGAGLGWEGPLKWMVASLMLKP
jgi:hypothetical protein